MMPWHHRLPTNSTDVGACSIPRDAEAVSWRFETRRLAGRMNRLESQLAAARAVCLSLAERVAAQDELLNRKAERGEG